MYKKTNSIIKNSNIIHTFIREFILIRNFILFCDKSFNINCTFECNNIFLKRVEKNFIITLMIYLLT